MYTQCPECETYFRVTEDDLEAAEGQVRCSQCEAIFDARARLLTPAQEVALGENGAAEPLSAIAADADAGTRPDAPLSEPETPPTSALKGGADDPAIGDLFADDAGADATGAERDPSFDLGAVDALDGPRADPSFDAAALPSEPAVDPSAPRAELPTPTIDEALPRAPLGFELPTGASPLLTQAGRPRPKRGPWLAACAALVVTLVAQVVHANREPLTRDPALGPTVVGAYRALHLPIAEPTDLGKLAVQRADVTSHPVYRDVLYITATVTNEAAFPQPLPLLRVRLDDRWGEPVGVRIFRPEEYLRRAEPSARAEPGRAYGIALEVVDPGNEAVGYALTPCLPQGDALVCLGDG